MTDLSYQLKKQRENSLSSLGTKPDSVSRLSSLEVSMKNLMCVSKKCFRKGCSLSGNLNNDGAHCFCPDFRVTNLNLVFHFGSNCASSTLLGNRDRFQTPAPCLMEAFNQKVAVSMEQQVA